MTRSLAALLQVAICLCIALPGALGTLFLGFTTRFPSSFPPGVMYLGGQSSVDSFWSLTAPAVTNSQAQVRVIDGGGRIATTSSICANGQCTATLNWLNGGSLSLAQDANFTYSQAPVPWSWAFIADGVAAPASKANGVSATRPIDFMFIAIVKMQKVSISSNLVAAPRAVGVGQQVTLTVTFNVPMSQTDGSSTMNGLATTRNVNLYTVSFTRTMTTADLGGLPSKLVTFAALASSFKSIGGLGCVNCAAAGSSLTSTTDGTFVVLYPEMDVTSISVSSTNVDPTIAFVGDTVTLKAQFNLNVNQTSAPYLVCKINGFAATTLSAGPDFYLCSRVITAADLNGKQSAQVTFSLSTQSVQSSVGLPCVTTACKTMTAVTAGNPNVIMQAASPLALLSVSIASSNVNPTRARVGDTVTLSFQFDQSVSSSSAPICSLIGSAAVATILNNRIDCSHVVTASDPGGVVTFSADTGSFVGSLGQACTLGGCSVSTVTATTDGSSVTVCTLPLTENSFSRSAQSEATATRICLDFCF